VKRQPTDGRKSFPNIHPAGEYNIYLEYIKTSKNQTKKLQITQSAH
jgi:hypothetical protein